MPSGELNLTYPKREVFLPAADRWRIFIALCVQFPDDDDVVDDASGHCTPVFFAFLFLRFLALPHPSSSPAFDARAYFLVRFFVRLLFECFFWSSSCCFFLLLFTPKFIDIFGG